MGLFSRRKRQMRLYSPPDLDMDALIAAAVEVRSEANETAIRRSLPLWQRQALEFYDLLGECWYPAQFYGRMLSRVRLHPARLLGNGEYEEVEDAQAQEILSRIQDPGGGTEQWKEAYGRLQFIIGDGYLAASVEDGSEQWEYLSPAELKQTDDGWKRVLDPGGKAREYLDANGDLELEEGEMRVWRLWRRHPTHTNLADSPVRGVLHLYEYLMLADKAARAQALSRIVGSGLLVVADEITIPGADVSDDENIDEDPFVSRLTQHIVTPISNPGSAAAVAPLVARVQMGEKRADDLIKLIQLHDPTQAGDWHSRIKSTIERLALNLDMPPEEFLGLSGANHWTGWVITDEKWKAHGEPTCIRLCGDLTAAYFRQACIEAGVTGADELVVWFDAANVVTHPDRGKDANETHDRGGLSDKALRRAHNFSERDAPSPEEREWFETMKLKGSNPDDESEAGEEGTGDGIEGSEPEDGGEPRTNQPSPQSQGEARILGAADLALERCRQLAAGRVLARKMSCPECFRGVTDTPKGEVIAALGPEVVAALGFESAAALVSGGTEDFTATIMRWGVPAGKAGLLSRMLEQHAAETIYDAEVSVPASFTEELT